MLEQNTSMYLVQCRENMLRLENKGGPKSLNNYTISQIALKRDISEVEKIRISLLLEKKIFVEGKLNQPLPRLWKEEYEEKIADPTFPR